MKSKNVITKFKDFKLNESTEFNFLRFNPDSVRPAVAVDDKSLSLNAYDRNAEQIRVAMTRIEDIMYNLKGTNAYKDLRSKLGLEHQDIQNMKIIRILKSNNINYDVYIQFGIDGEEYWGVVKNILVNPEIKSEVFKDQNLYQSKEWVIKIKGLIIKTIKNWLKPEPGNYRLLNNEVTCYSTETGKMLKMEKGIEIEVVRSHDNKIIIRFENDTYNLTGDNYIYFNYWFEKVS